MSRQRSGGYAVRSGKCTDILGIRNPRYRFTMLERWSSRITARKLRSVVLKLSLDSFLKSPKEQYFAYQHLPKKCLPTYRMVLMTLRVTWSHRVQYYYRNRTVVKSKANFDAFRSSMFICFPHRVCRGLSQYIGE